MVNSEANPNFKTVKSIKLNVPSPARIKSMKCLKFHFLGFTLDKKVFNLTTVFT